MAVTLTCDERAACEKSFLSTREVQIFRGFFFPPPKFQNAATGFVFIVRPRELPRFITDRFS